MLLLSPRCRGVSGVLRDGCVGTAVTAVLCSGQGRCPRLALPCWPVWRPWLPSAVSAGARAGPREPGWFGSPCGSAVVQQEPPPHEQGTWRRSYSNH